MASINYCTHVTHCPTHKICLKQISLLHHLGAGLCVRCFLQCWWIVWFVGVALYTIEMAIPYLGAPRTVVVSHAFAVPTLGNFTPNHYLKSWVVLHPFGVFSGMSCTIYGNCLCSSVVARVMHKGVLSLLSDHGS